MQVAYSRFLARYLEMGREDATVVCHRSFLSLCKLCERFEREAHRRLGPASKIKRITLDVEDGKRNDARAPKAIFPLLFAFAEIYKPA
jgi:hypothetical protein